jgi:hypothetical protein
MAAALVTALAGCGLVLDTPHGQDGGSLVDAAFDGGGPAAEDAALDAWRDGPDGDATVGDVGTEPDASAGDAFVPACSEEDLDSDGFSECEGDCDDEDVTRYPGAPYVCGDGVVNDCLVTTTPTGDDPICLTDDLYVSERIGDDSGTGTPDDPFRTIQRGIDEAATRGAGAWNVIVAQGDYAEDLRLVDGVSLRGGREEGSWRYDPATFRTIVRPSSGEGLFVPGAITSATTLEGLELEQERPRSLGTMGVEVASGAAPTFETFTVRAHASVPVLVGMQLDPGASPRLRGVTIEVGGATSGGAGLFGLRGVGASVAVEGLLVRIGNTTSANVFGVDLGAAPTDSVLLDVQVRTVADMPLASVTGVRLVGLGGRIERADVRVGLLASTGTGQGLVLASPSRDVRVVNSVLVAGSGGRTQTALAVRYEGGLPFPIPRVVIHSNTLDAGVLVSTAQGTALELSGPVSAPAGAMLGEIRGNILRLDGGAMSSFAVRALRVLPVAFTHNAIGARDGARLSLTAGYAPDPNNLLGETCGVPMAGDYHLPSGSPCIGASTSTDAPLLDIDGEMRDAEPDIGADERLGG